MKVLSGSLILLMFFIACGRQTDGTRVQRGKFLATLTETGELQALESKVITMPAVSRNFGDAKIVALIKEGTAVRQGDWVGQIDTTGIIRYRVQRQTELAIAKADLQKMLVQNESELQMLRAQLSAEEAALRQAQIDTQRTRFEAPSKKEIARLQLKIAEIAYRRALSNIEHAQKIQQENLLIQKVRIKQIEAAIRSADEMLEKFNLKAPGDGIVEYKKVGWREQVKIKVGVEPRRGEAIIGLPDLSRMKAVTSVGEADIGKLAMGQQVFVRLDAFPNEVFDGKIIYIAQVCVEKEQNSRIKVFDVEVLIEQPRPICRPGMTASCEIVTAELQDVLFVDNKYLHEKDGQYFVSLQRGAKVEAVPVALGPRNARSVVVSGKLKAGEKLVETRSEEGA